MNLSNLTPTVRQLLFINVAVFVFTDFLVPSFYRQLGVPEETKDLYFAVQPLESGFFIPTQVLTHMFTHGNFMHLLFNMFGLITFGPPLESVLRKNRFLILYFAAGVGALGLQWLIAPQTALVGASVAAEFVFDRRGLD